MATGCLSRRVVRHHSDHLTNLNNDIMSVLVAKEAPDFKAAAAMPDGSIGEIQLSSLRGKYVILFFWPLDFTFVCPTENSLRQDHASNSEKDRY